MESRKAMMVLLARASKEFPRRNLSCQSMTTRQLLRAKSTISTLSRFLHLIARKTSVTRLPLGARASSTSTKKVKMQQAMVIVANLISLMASVSAVMKKRRVTLNCALRLRQTRSLLSRSLMPQSMLKSKRR